jgi:predicted dehydrogenase
MQKVALIGTGFIAVEKHLPAWQKARGMARVVALCDVDLERAKEIAQQFGIPKVYSEYRTLLEAENPDLIDICTPPATHAALALQAIERGAHVLIEKPMAVSTPECDAILAAAREKKRKVCVAHSDLFYPVFIKARELVRRGIIGEFRGMRIFLSTPVDYMTSKPNHWAHRLPGGMIGETGPHVVYLTLAFINPVQQVRVHAQKLLPEFPWSRFEDYRLELIGEKAVSSITLVYTTRHWGAQVEIWGSEGALKLDLESQTLVRYRRGHLTHFAVALSGLSEAAQIVKSLLGTGADVLTRRFQNTHALLIRRYLESVRNGAEPPVTAQEGREAVRVMSLIVEQLERQTV